MTSTYVPRRRLERYVAAYAERFGSVPRATPELGDETYTPRHLEAVRPAL